MRRTGALRNRCGAPASFGYVVFAHFQRMGVPMADKNVRLSLEMSAEINATLDRLAEQLGTTKAEVMRKGIALMDVAADAKRKGKAFGVADSPDALSLQIVGL